MKTPAPYTRETLEFLRTRSERAGVHELAVMLGWDAPRIRAIAQRHDIKVREDNPAGVEVVVAKTLEPDSRSRKRHSPGFVARQNKLGDKRKRKLHARDCCATLCLSKAAVAEIAALAETESKRATGVAAIVIDFIARTGRLKEFYDLAKTEAA